MGASGDGTLNIEAGGSVSSGISLISNAPDATGEVTVTGSGSRWDLSSGLGVGVLGSGLLNVEAGGVVSSLGNGNIGSNNVNSVGVATVTGQGSQWNSTGGLTVGGSGNGTLHIENGGLVSSAGGEIGEFSGSLGLVMVTGVGSRWETNGNVTIGNLGQAILNVEATGSVNVVGDLSIGDDGEVNLDAGNLTASTIILAEDGQFNWTNNSSLRITGPSGVTLGSGNFFTNAFSLENGQTLIVDNTLTIDAATVLLLDGGSLNSGALALNGGNIVGTTLDVDATGGLLGFGLVGAPVFGNQIATTIQATGGLTLGSVTSTTGFDFAGTLDVGSNRVELLDADAANLGFGTLLAAGGELGAAGGMILDAGERIVSSGDALIRGALTHNGTVIGPTAIGESLTVNDDVAGPGSFAGNITFSQTYSPGASPAEVDFGDGDLNLAGTSVLELEIFGPTPGSEYDRIRNINDVAIEGVLRLIFDGYTPTAGMTFDFLDFVNFVSDFNEATQLEVIGFDAAMLDFSNFTTTGEVQVVVPVLRGDFNGDGVVNLADYTVWRDSRGASGIGLAADGDRSGVIDANDYTIWKSNFGNAVSALLETTTDAAVPEPNARLPILIALLGLLECRYRPF